MRIGVGVFGNELALYGDVDRNNRREMLTWLLDTPVAEKLKAIPFVLRRRAPNSQKKPQKAHALAESPSSPRTPVQSARTHPCAGWVLASVGGYMQENEDLASSH